MSGTVTAHACTSAIRGTLPYLAPEVASLCCYAICGTGGMLLRTCYAMSGTALPHGAISLCLWYWPSVCCYAICGTGLAYASTPSAELA
eukprot:2230188-Rhodomonas_salina.1